MTRKLNRETQDCRVIGFDGSRLRTGDAGCCHGHVHVVTMLNLASLFWASIGVFEALLFQLCVGSTGLFLCIF